jgi:hypothetical protein
MGRTKQSGISLGQYAIKGKGVHCQGKEGWAPHFTGVRVCGRQAVSQAMVHECLTIALQADNAREEISRVSVSDTV